uniref:Uncharacterized protein n=1 Tax=Parascaris univalens TaxID=6257 RepID=A0A915B8F8_PARUN
MSSACNRISMNLDAIAGGSEIDEETWLVEPPKTDSSTQSSGHIIEWLQGAAANVDYKTRTALSRTLASQAARRKPRPTEKIKPISPRLNSLAECVEPPASNAGCQKKSINALSSPRSLEMANGASPNVTPRANTARIAPTIMNKSLSHSPRDEKSVRNSAPLVSKAHSLTNPDLRDIEQIAEMQEIALREEVMQRQRKTSTQSDSSNTPLSRPQTGPSSAHSTKSNPAMASSRSVDFFVEAQGAPSAPHPTTHVSRLPTPLRRPGGTMRSMIPTPTSRISVPKVAVRGLAGGSTPSLAPFDTRRPADETQSECGRNEWADECF